MEDRESLVRKQEELLSEQFSSVGGYALAPSPSQSRMSQRMYGQQIHQQQLPQQQHLQQHAPQQVPQQAHQTRQEGLAQQLQQQRPLNGSYTGLQPRLSMRLPGPALPNGSIYQGYIPGRPTQGIATSQPLVGRSPVVRSNSIYSNHMAGVPRYQPSSQRQQPIEQNLDLQKRQYQQYEQQQHYYREPNSMAGADLSAVRPAFGPAPYRQSKYQGVYTGSPQTRMATPRQQQIQQMQTQRPMSLGPISPNRFPVARDMLPTAPSPSVFSATQPVPVFPEPASSEPASSEPALSEPSSSGTDVPSSTSHPGSDTPSPAPEVIARNPNRNSGYSLYSPVMERARPRSTIIEPSGVMASPLTLHASMSATSLINMARPSPESQRGTMAHSAPSSTSRSSHAQSFSRQVTLPSIPANEEVPPMPGKVTSKTGKVRIQLTFDRPFFNAGGELSGRLEIQCSSSRSVMLADMFIELLGYEALAKDHFTPKIFHKTILRLQDVRHASQAVQENVEPDAEGYWLARKGRTIFPFRLNIQDTLPNSYDSKLGQVRYVASAIACMKASQSKEVVNHTREVIIYETWTTDDITQARKKSVKADTSKRLFMGGDGSLEMYAELTRTMVSSGGIVYVNVGVKNLTKKKIMGIKLSLWRHIAASQARPSISSQPSMNGPREQDNVKNYSEIIYKGEDYAFDSDDPRLVVLPVYIPSGVYSLRNTTFLHVQFFIQVSLLASMSKALTVELPLYISHASSWSDPPPRIPRDFTFPVHEDKPVKKHKTGVFAKKRPNSMVTHTGSGVISPKKQSCSVTSNSAPTSKTGTPRLATAETPLMDRGGSRPITRWSPLKDPDSPTSVLDFSQAGNLFVVNPDSSSITGSDAGLMLSQPMSAWSSPAIHAGLEICESPVPSHLSSPLDRSAPHMPVDQEQLKDNDHSIQDVVNTEEDFDMSRSVNTHVSPSRKDQEKSKHGKMGLRKTLAKLSISIPTHGPGSCSSYGNSSKLSPRVLPTTPRSNKSQLNSSDELSAGSRSPGAGESLSRQSSASSLGSFNSRFENYTRKSSVGSTRVVTMSPGPISPEGQVSISSPAKSALTLMSNSTMALTNASGASSQDDTVQSRSTTSSPSDHIIGHYHSEPSTPSSPRQPWQVQRKLSTSSIAYSRLEQHENPQTAQGIRDEYYFGKGSLSRDAFTESYVTRVAPAQTGIPSQEHVIYTTDGKIYDEPLTVSLIDQPAPLPLPPQAQPVFYMDASIALNRTEQLMIEQQQEQQQQQIFHGILRQSPWTSNQYEDERPHTPSHYNLSRHTP